MDTDRPGALFACSRCVPYLRRPGMVLHFPLEDDSARICAFDTDWDDEAEDAADNYDDDTVLSLNWQDPCLTNHEIANFAADYGPSGWAWFRLHLH